MGKSGTEVQRVKSERILGFRGSPVKFATLLFCEKFNGASRVERFKR